MSAIPAGYKQTDVGVLPEDWAVSSCCSIADRIMVGIVIRPTQYYVQHGVPALRSANIREDGITSSDLVYISEQSNSLLSKSQTRDGDVLTVRTGYPGTSAVVPAEFAGCNCIDILITRPSKLVNSEYLAMWINSPFGKEQVLRNQGGLAQKHFNVGDMRNLLVALPMISEQRAIATALSDVDALLAKLDQLIAKKRDLKQAAMQQLLTGQTRLPGFSGVWELKRLSQLGHTYGGLSGKTKENFGHGSARYIPFMNVMTDTVIDPDWLEQVDVSLDEMQNTAKKGDLFFNGSSETPEEVGFCSVLLEDILDLYLNSFCFGFRFKPDAKVSGLFFAYWFRGNEGRKAMALLAQGATRYNIAKSAFLQLEIPQPAAEEQTAIATILADMDAELTALETRRDKTRAIKQGMMQELLTGRIRLV